jgi:TRAP-type C4-dicarboxylate transport system substrate-binding protein
MMRTLLLATAAAVALSVPVAQAQAPEPTTLKFGFTSPPTSFVHVFGSEPWSKEVEAASNGTLKIQMFFNNILGTVFNIYDRTVNGVVDISFGTIATVQGTFPRATVSGIPFTVENPYEASLALYRLHTTGVISQEFQAVKVLTLFTFSSSSVQAVKEVRNVEEAKGLKMGAASKTVAQAWELLGAVPVTLAPAESYQALQRNLIQGVNMSWPAVLSFKLHEVTKFHMEAPFGLAGAYFFMNKDSYAKLPEVARKAIDTYSGEPLTKKLGGGGIEENKSVINKLKAMPGHVYAELQGAEKERWRKLFEPITEEWVRTTPDGAKVLAAFRQEVEKVRKEEGMR